MKRYKIVQKSNFIGGSIQNKQCDGFTNLPSIVDNKNIDRIIAIGDIHGDLDLAIKYLEISNVIKRVYVENDMTVSMFYKDEPIKRIYEWIGLKTIVVQVGDQVDRCRPDLMGNECHMSNTTKNDESSDITIMFFYYDLHVKAEKVGCALYSLLGNHEILNVIGNMSYVSYMGLQEFNGNVGRVNVFKRDTDVKLYKELYTIPEFLACTHLTSIVINGYLFVHAGLMEKLIDQYENVIPSINEIIKNWLLNNNDDLNNARLNSLLLSQQTSPFWPRIFGTLKPHLGMSDHNCTKHVKPVLEKLNLKGMIIGHTPQIGKTINSTCSDTIWRVDIGSSHAFDEVLYPTNATEKTKATITNSRKPHVLQIKFNGSEPDTYSIVGL